MPTLDIKKKDGSGAGSVALSEKVFQAPVNKGLIFQAVQTETANSRQGTQSTKTRAIVHHTTRKPYKQKGTGRARQGMTSAPHYRHGGIALGPLPRDIVRDMPKKMRRAAIAGALSAKVADEAIQVIDSLSFEAISTKAAAGILKDLSLTGKRILIVVAKHDPVVYKSFRNIPNVEVRIAPGFSTRDVLAAETILFTKEALDKVQPAQEA
ncbi:MAG: 50S ribosomal protein L4 [Capsulimonadaceae bacterium]|nr:50S ribosomal protein L4 [Capsulimonadaceae bacterium]